MPGTLRAYRNAISDDLGGHYPGRATLTPEADDPIGLSVILQAKLFDAEKGTTSFGGAYSYIPEFGEEQRVKQAGFRTRTHLTFLPPSSGTYTFTVYGFGVSHLLASASPATSIQNELRQVTNLQDIEVSGTPAGGYTIKANQVLPITASKGTLDGSGGVGLLETAGLFTRPIVAGTEFDLHRMPVTDRDGFRGLNAVVNRALRYIWYVDDLPIDGATTQVVHDLAGKYPFLNKRRLVQYLQFPVEWELAATFTPPESGTYTLTMRTSIDRGPTGDLNYNATGAQIEAALRAISGLDGVSVSPQGSTGPFVVTWSGSRHAGVSLVASAGKVVNSRSMLQEPLAVTSGYRFQYAGERPYLSIWAAQEDASWLLKAFRPAHTKICPQVDWETPGTEWIESKAGLVGESDQARPTVDEVRVVGYWRACQQLAKAGPSGEVRQWLDEAHKAAGVVAAGVYDQDDEEGRRSATRGEVVATKNWQWWP